MVIAPSRIVADAVGTSGSSTVVGERDNEPIWEERLMYGDEYACQMRLAGREVHGVWADARQAGPPRQRPGAGVGPRRASAPP
jgi:hypothetical protein